MVSAPPATLRPADPEILVQVAPLRPVVGVVPVKLPEVENESVVAVWPKTWDSGVKMANRNTAAKSGFIFGKLAIDDMGFPVLRITASCYVQMSQILRSAVAGETIDFMQTLGAVRRQVRKRRPIWRTRVGVTLAERLVEIPMPQARNRDVL